MFRRTWTGNALAVVAFAVAIALLLLLLLLLVVVLGLLVVDLDLLLHFHVDCVVVVRGRLGLLRLLLAQAPFLVALVRFDNVGLLPRGRLDLPALLSRAVLVDRRPLDEEERLRRLVRPAHEPLVPA